MAILAGILPLPVLVDDLRHFVQPRAVPEQFQHIHGGEEFDAVLRRVAEGFKQPGGHQGGDVMRLAAQHPAGLLRRQAGGQLPQQRQKLVLIVFHAIAVANHRQNRTAIFGSNWLASGKKRRRNVPMRNEKLILPHPVEHLKMYDLDRQKWDVLNPPELSHVKGPEITPYMPPLIRVDVIGKVGVKTPESGPCKFVFKLSHPVNELWQMFFENHRNGANVTFEDDRLTIYCEPQELHALEDHICNFAIHATTRDYFTERDILLRQVFHKMKELERLERVEAEILAERESYQQQIQQRILAAETNGWAVSIICQNFNRNYREILENKFRWWSRILDAQTIRKYQAMFEFDMLPG